MVPPTPLRYANEIRSPDLDPAYTSPATPARRRRPRAVDQKPAAGDAVAQTPQQPDIEWIPSFKSYRDRNLRRLRNGGLKKTLPEGFPTKLESPLAWEGDELREEEYIVELSALEIEETEEALRDFKCKFFLTGYHPLQDFYPAVSFLKQHFFPALFHSPFPHPFNCPCSVRIEAHTYHSKRNFDLMHKSTKLCPANSWS